MGQPLASEDLISEEAFTDLLRDETRLVMSWFRDGVLERRAPPLIGAEVEAWLVDGDALPAPRNGEFLERADGDDLDAELSQFNFELNLDPLELTGGCLAGLFDHMSEVWARCARTAEAMDARALMIGIPPTLRADMLSLETMTPASRYRALNDRVMHMRGGAPLNYCFTGREELEFAQDHLMLEAACTSLQIHLMLDPDRQARQFNAAMMASAPVLAAAANAPYLYGRRLWEETRIPAFEQAVDIKGYREPSGRRANRVTFGTGYLRNSLMELFLENLDGYAPLLPVAEETPREALRHLKLQNGTIWRWNRPIIDVNKAGVPHIRLENRVMPAGPTCRDMTANAAFLIGLILHLSQAEADAESRLDFETARENFYAAARNGLGARTTWLDGETGDVGALIYNRLAGQAQTALIDAGVDAYDARLFMDVIRKRAKSGVTGAAWQRAWVNCNGRDFQGLTEAYLELQASGRPVHRWTV